MFVVANFGYALCIVDKLYFTNFPTVATMVAKQRRHLRGLKGRRLPKKKKKEKRKRKKEKEKKKKKRKKEGNYEKRQITTYKVLSLPIFQKSGGIDKKFAPPKKRLK